MQKRIRGLKFVIRKIFVDEIEKLYIEEVKVVKEVYHSDIGHKIHNRSLLVCLSVMQVHKTNTDGHSSPIFLPNVTLVSYSLLQKGWQSRGFSLN